MKKIIAGLSLVALSPFLALAANHQNAVQAGENLRDTIIEIINNVIVPVLIAVAFGFFVWGIIEAFFFKPGDPEKRQEGIRYMLWGIVAFAVVLSAWGIVNLAAGVAGGIVEDAGGDTGAIETPEIQFNN